MVARGFLPAVLAALVAMTIPTGVARAQSVQFLFEFGAYGTADGRFDEQRGLTVDAAGKIYVADFYNHRLQVFDPDGVHLQTVGSPGSAPGQMNKPNDVAIDGNGRIVVADTYNQRIQVFDPSGAFLFQFGGWGIADGQFKYPWFLTVDASDNIIVSDNHNHRVQVFDPAGSFLFKFGTNGTGPGQLDFPLDVVVNDANEILVADGKNCRVCRFDSTGGFLDCFGSLGPAEGQFLPDGPHGLALDDAGRIYAVDNNSHRVQIFDADGSFLSDFGTHGTGQTEFDWPVSVAVDPSGRVLVSDVYNHRIQVFETRALPPELTLWNKLGSETEALNSAFGPDLEVWTPGTHPGTGCCDEQANRIYVPGQHGDAVGMTGLYGFSLGRIHNLVLTTPAAVINPDRGTVELWYKQLEKPVGFHHGIYRLFGGEFGLGAVVKLQVAHDNGTYPDRVQFSMAGASQFILYELTNITDGVWTHLAGVWDRAGIDGTSETMRLYVDGVPVVTATANDWFNTVTGMVDICGGQDRYVGDKFLIDNLMVWDVARTGFEDRFEEEPQSLNEAPVITCLDPIVDNDPGQCSAEVDCASIAVCSDADGDSVALSCDPAGPYDVGGHTVAVTCDDGQEVTTAGCGLAVLDTEPPEVSVLLAPAELWPPNHHMIDVEALVAAGDNCDASPAVVLVSVDSNEADNGEGDGNTVNDIQGAESGTADLEFQLRAERSGLAGGRIYTATYSATDAAVNEAHAANFVFVPHDQGGVIDPVSLWLEQTPLGTSVHWNEVWGAVSYDVIRGDLCNLEETSNLITLGPVTCIEGDSTDCCTDGFEDAEHPVPGGIFFYLVQYDDGTTSSYGSESAGKPRWPETGVCE